VRTTGSRAYFKAKLQRTDVSGKVKGHFKSHMEFMCLLGEKVVIEQGVSFFEKFDIQNKDINMDIKFEILNEILDLFLTEYHYIPPVFRKNETPCSITTFSPRRHINSM
jgi:hypothetical protein